jgi:hypothetical protein
MEFQPAGFIEHLRGCRLEAPPPCATRCGTARQNHLYFVLKSPVRAPAAVCSRAREARGRVEPEYVDETLAAGG